MSDKKVVVLLIAVVGVLAGIGLLLLAVRQGSASPLAAPVAANPLSAGVVPGQFIAKIHTEAYGRLPTQAEWQALVDRFENAASCVDTVRQVVEEFYTGITFTNLYAPDVDGNRPAALLALYRGALNRELDTDSYQHYRSFPYPWATLVDDLLDNRHRQELAALTADICDLGVPPHYMVAPYYWNPDYAPLVLTPTGPIEDPWVFCGAYCGETDDDLRQLLYSATATPTRTVYLAQMAVVWITPTTMIFPKGVTLTTWVEPSQVLTPTRYARMGRLVRATRENAPMLVLQTGDALQSVWLDGQQAQLTTVRIPAAHNVDVWNDGLPAAPGGLTATRVLNNRLPTPWADPMSAPRAPAPAIRAPLSTSSAI